jgi:hypothetical protein
LISFSFRLVSDQSLIGSGVASVAQEEGLNPTYYFVGLVEEIAALPARRT